MMDFENLVAGLESEARRRRIPDGSGANMVDLCSNDYLGLSQSSVAWRSEFFDLFPDAVFSSSASRLLSRQQKYHKLLEERLSSLYARASLLFNSGYHANVGCIGALSQPGTLFICDKLIHASVIDGLHCATAEFTRFRHNDILHLRKIIEAKGALFHNIVVVVESVYSMDGDIAPLKALVDLKKEYPSIILYVDEAHAVGVFGDQGLGMCEKLGITKDVDIIIGTAGKALASYGAFAITSPELREWLVNASRSLIFSTALPPVCCAWTLFMLEKSIGMNNRRQHLHSLSKWFVSALLEIDPSQPGSDTQIVPWLTGNAKNALLLGKILADNGFDALPIRRPTVPPGGERIRFSLNALLDRQSLLPLLDVLSN